MFLKVSFFLLLMAVIVMCVMTSGCAHTEYRQITAGNRSTIDISFVEIGTEKAKSRFGYLGPSASGGKTSSSCAISFSKKFGIRWKEASVARHTQLNIMQYKKRKDRIDSFAFFYLGDGNWQIVAQERDLKDNKPNE